MLLDHSLASPAKYTPRFTARIREPRVSVTFRTYGLSSLQLLPCAGCSGQGPSHPIKYTLPRDTFSNETHQTNGVSPSSAWISLQSRAKDGSPPRRTADARSRPDSELCCFQPGSLRCSLVELPVTEAALGVFPVYSGAGPMLGYVMVA